MSAQWHDVIVQFLPFVTFAFVASITPGPSNLLVLGNSARHGFLAALPIVWGSCLGSAAIVLMVGLGIGQWLTTHPHIQTAMGWAGALWLSYLAWQIATQPADAQRSAATRPTAGLTAAAIQVGNPKAWGMAFAVVSIFAGENAGLDRYALLSGLFLLISIPCLGTWAALGSASGSMLTSGKAAKGLNIVLALALFASAWVGFLQHG